MIQPPATMSFSCINFNTFLLLLLVDSLLSFNLLTPLLLEQTNELL